jgi:hypothetical protein
MLIWTTLALLLLSGVALWRLPRPLLHGYRRSFGARHGIGVQVGLTVLATATLSMLWATLLRPGFSPAVEQLNAAIVVLGVIAGSYDLYLFAKSASRGK